MQLPHRTLGQSLEVTALGLGCMGLSIAYGSTTREEGIGLIRRALELGVNFFDTACSYGDNESLLGEALSDARDQAVIATKFGILSPPVGTKRLDGSPENARRTCEQSLKRLRTEKIDLYYLHRVDPEVPIERSMEAMAMLVDEGMVGHIGLSEVSAEQIRRAHSVHRITAIQSEYSLWARDVETEILPVCEELGIGFVPFSPLGRGMLTGRLKDLASLPDDDRRRAIPRFSEENIRRNLRLIDELETIAREHGCSPGQVAIAWLLRKKQFIVPIPGTKNPRYLNENLGALDVRLSETTMETLEGVFAADAPAGSRKPVQ